MYTMYYTRRTDRLASSARQKLELQGKGTREHRMQRYPFCARFSYISFDDHRSPESSPAKRHIPSVPAS